MSITKIGQVVVVSLLVALGVGCHASESKLPGEDPEQLPGMNPDEHLLMQPTGDASRLLGRGVEETGHGWLINDDPTPGCEVKIISERTNWTRSFYEEYGRMAALGVRGQQLGELIVEYEKLARLRAEVHNTEVKRAVLKGTCAPLVVSKVYLGSGKREVSYKRDIGGGACARTPSGCAGAEANIKDSRGGAIEWEDQVWGFEVSAGPTEAYEIQLDFPAKIVAGEPFQPKLSANRSMWIIVLYRDANGDYGILLPNPDTQAFLLPSDTVVDLPVMKATNLPGHVSDEEKIVVYGFFQEGDFKQLAPPEGHISQDESNRYVEDLEEGLRDNEIPADRWIVKAFGYLVEAREGNQLAPESSSPGSEL